jgi:acyl-homoserine-lactone acylase
MKVGRGVGLAAALLALAAPAAAAQQRQRYDATVVRTTYGIPHITARDHASLGYGVGYTAGEDNVCVLADQLITVRGERSAFHGEIPTGMNLGGPSNIESDVYYRIVGDVDAIRRGFGSASPDAQALIRGFAAGYNRYLRDNAARLPAPCAGQAWVRPMTVEDALLLMNGSLMPPTFLRQMASAAPPGTASAGAGVGLPRMHDPETALGSNGWAFGSEATANGRGLVVGNPHYPWEGANRFRQMHLTIPGQLDVMGAGLVVTPFVAIGFNRDVAWTHTVTTAQHMTLFELQLTPGDPTSYMVDGRPERMVRREVTIPVRGGAPVRRTLYSSRYGPIAALSAAGLGWTAERAFAIRNANQNNQRGIDTWLGISRARNVRQIRQTIGRTLGVPFTNTIAADRGGEALYADVTAVPFVTAEKIERCGTQAGRAPPLVAQRIFVLDGSRSACAWDVDPRTPEAGLMPERMMPTLFRRDFVQNSNDSYWLSNPAAPLAAASPIIGAVGTRPGFRTQSGILEIQRRLANGRKLDQASARELILSNRSMAAERVMDDLVAICDGDPALSAACTALRGWDRRADLNSRGALLFFAFLRHAGQAQIPNMYRVPFDPANPVNTPSGLAPGAAEPIRRALTAAVAEMTTLGLPLDAPLGQVQAIAREGGRIPIHGGPNIAGILNMMQSRPAPGGIEPVHGSSYIQVVSFEAGGPVADAILTYSQSTDSRSPHSWDQTRAFSEKRWNRLPFTAAEVRRATIGQPLRIRE